MIKVKELKGPLWKEVNKKVLSFAKSQDRFKSAIPYLHKRNFWYFIFIDFPKETTVSA